MIEDLTVKDQYTYMIVTDHAMLTCSVTMNNLSALFCFDLFFRESIEITDEVCVYTVTNLVSVLTNVLSNKATYFLHF